jgi:hypothetical protein
MLACGVLIPVSLASAAEMKAVPLTQGWSATISDDGRTMASWGGAIWTEAGGTTDFTTLSGGIEGQFLALSGDGRTVTGRNGSYAFRLTENRPIEILQDLAQDARATSPNAINADGRTIIGSVITGPSSGFIWRESDGMRPLDQFSSDTRYSLPLDVSDNGGVVVGEVGLNGSSFSQAFRWTVDRGPELLGTLPTDWSTLTFYDGASSRGVSGDGRTVVGFSYGDTSQAFRWTEQSGMVGLGFLNEPSPLNPVTFAHAASFDGSLIVGESGRGGQTTSDTVAFLWSEEDGMRPLADVLTDRGVDLSGWRHVSGANDITPDGRWVAGYGVLANGSAATFRADLWPVPAGWISGDATDDGQVNLADFGVLRANFGAEGLVDRWDLGDFNLDGRVDLADFGLLRANFGEGSDGAAAMDAWLPTVPEPAGLALVAAAGLGLVRRRGGGG